METDITPMPYDPRRVCVNCFSDAILQDLIEREGKNGTCDWCDSNDLKTIPVYELSDKFRSVADCYDEVTGPDAYIRGETISGWLQQDWNIFSPHIEEDMELIQEMTLAILVADTRPKERLDLPDYSGFFRIELPELEFEWFDKLEKLLNDKKTDLKSKDGDHLNGFPGRIELAIEESARTFKAGKIYWRARIHEDRKRKIRFVLSEMGAPPAKDARAGRANKSKEPVLYLATNDNTALAEVRAWRGMAVALAKVRLKRDVRLLDLTELNFPKSPFETEYLCYDLQVIGLLQSFGLALSHPLLPDEEDRLYLPSQELCKYIRQQNIDGVIYPSAMGDGKNIVLFNPDDGEPYEVDYYRIEAPKYPCKMLDDYEEIYDEWPYEHLVDDIRGKDEIKIKSDNQ